jgi:addiction module HigA family antidote
MSSISFPIFYCNGKINTKAYEEIMKRNLSAIHPGEILLEDFMKPYGLSQYRVAKDIGVTALRISQIVHGKRAITADTAMRLARYFGTSASVWLRLQARYDLESVEKNLIKRIRKQVKTLKVA